MSSLRHDALLACRALAVFTVLTGLLYPGVVTAIGQLLLPHRADGSLITIDGQVRGSTLIGQAFTGDRYFHGRPSAVGYNAAGSGGSNLGPLAPALDSAVRARRLSLGAPGVIPVDLLTSSGSGLDPDLSPAGAAVQVGRVARARGLDSAAVAGLVAAHRTPRTLGLLGEPRVNVLRLNLALDSLTP